MSACVYGVAVLVSAVRRWGALLAVLVIAALGSARAFPMGNLLTNPEFEDGLVGWGKEGTATAIGISDELVRSGEGAGVFYDVTTSYGGRGLVSDSVPVVPGEVYSFGMWSFVQATDAPPEGYWRFVQLLWVDTDGQVLGSHPAVGSRYEEAGEWTLSCLTALAPEEATGARLRLRARRAGAQVPLADILLDDAFVVRGERHVVTATAAAGGEISPAGDSFVEQGGEAVFNIVPEEGFEIADVLLDGASVFEEVVICEGVSTFTLENVREPHAVHAAFSPARQVTVSLAVVGKGRVEVDGTAYDGPVNVDPGTQVHLVAVPAAGARFCRWEDGSSESTRTITVVEDTHLAAEFQPVPDCVVIGPHPVPREGCVFWLSLPEDAVKTTLTVFAADGVPLATVRVDPSAQRHPRAGRWEPRDDRGRLLGAGLYLLSVEIHRRDGGVTFCPPMRMVIAQ